MAVIMGIDPGSRVAGFGVIQCEGAELRHLVHGAIKLSVSKPLPQRLCELGSALAGLYERYQPEVTVIESIFLGQNVSSAFQLGHARGVCLYHAAQANSVVREYAPRAVKKGITGNGNAEKSQVRLVLQAQLRLQELHEPMDATDALALAVYHARALEVEQRLEENLRRSRQGVPL